MARAQLPFLLSPQSRSKIVEIGHACADLIESIANDFFGVNGETTEQPRTAKSRKPYRPSHPIDDVTSAKAAQLLNRVGYQKAKD